MTTVETREIAMHTVANMVIVNGRASDKFSHWSYMLVINNEPMRSIRADVADAELKKMGRIPYAQKKAFLWHLASK